jgi:hypothetical protein
VKSNKNDLVDAEAIAEAVERKNMRFVSIKTDDQTGPAGHPSSPRSSDLHTAVVNQLRAVSRGEYGLLSSSWNSNNRRPPASLYYRFRAHKLDMITGTFDRVEYKHARQAIVVKYGEPNLATNQTYTNKLGLKQ